MDINGNKDFQGWITLKEKLHNSGGKPRYIHEGDIWWYAAGENIRTEINGKSRRFSRPILVLKKFGDYSFWGVPLTTKKHNGDWYTSFEFDDEEQYAALIQMKHIDVARLYDRIGQLPASDLKKVRECVISLLNK